MSKHDRGSKHAAEASRPSSSAVFYEIDMTRVCTSHSLMEAVMEKAFKHLAGDERRTAIEEALGDTEHKLKDNLKTIKLLEERITILKRFLSDSSIAFSIL